MDANESQSSRKDKGKTSGKGQSSGKDQEPYVVTLEAGKSNAVGNDGSSQVPSQFVNEFYSSYDPYEESQDPKFDLFADLDLILPIVNNREGNTSQNVKVEDETKVEHETEDSDYLVDEDNNMDEVDVDMEEFEYNIHENVEFIRCRDRVQPLDNEEGDGKDVEVLDNDYFRSALDSDDEGSRLRKRKMKQLRKQAHTSEQIYSTYFYAGKEFPNKDEVKAYIKEHSIKTRSEIRMEKNDNERVRAVCRGVIPSLLALEDLGIIPTIAKLFLNTEHIFCVKHINENMKKKWNGAAYKEMLWRESKATTVLDFQLVMEKLKAFNEWAKSNVLLNNMCEVFNGKFVGRRDKPIIATLEFSTEYLMKRIVNVNKVIDRCDGPCTPTATKILKSNSDEAKKYSVDWGGDEFYQVSSPWGDQVIVNVMARTCTCRRWGLTGIPCKHAVAANWNMSLNNQHAGIPEERVHPCYRGMDLDTDARSQSKKRSTSEAASSATYTDNGKPPTTDDGPQNKRAPRKKVIVLG
ncbi:mutator type transposase [Tanacetum coccineum]